MDEQDWQRLVEWAKLAESATYYEMLGLEPTAGADAIRGAYHRFAACFHPDAYPSEGESVTCVLRQVFQQGTEAYRVLIDSDLRLKYDMALQRGQVRLSDRPISGTPEAGSTAGRPLHELCRSAGAKLAAKQADRLLTAGDLRGAQKQLLQALQYDGGANLALSERLEAIEVALYASGD